LPRFDGQEEDAPGRREVSPSARGAGDGGLAIAPPAATLLAGTRRERCRRQRWDRGARVGSCLIAPAVKPPASGLMRDNWTMPEVAGRDAELTALGEVLDELRAGRGRAVLVEGEAGIGKSALVAAALARDGSSGTRVLTGVCDQLTQPLPLSVVTQAIGLANGPGTQELEASPEAALDAGDPVRAGVEKLLGVVQGLCAAGPLVLVIEDLHWADEASVLWWRRLCRLTAQLPLVLVATRRPVPRIPGADVLGRDVQADGGVVLALSGLAPDAVAAMAAALVGGAPAPRLLQWLEHASGNPFYVRELVEEAARSGMLQASGGVVDLAGVVETPSAGDGLAGGSALLRGAVESRLDFLSQEALGVLRVAAILGPEFLMSDLAAVCGRTPAALLPVMEDSLAAGILEDSGARLRFRHWLLQQTLYDGIAGSARAGLHRQAARELMELDAPARRVARHLLAVAAADAWGHREVSWLADKSRRWLPNCWNGPCARRGRMNPSGPSLRTVSLMLSSYWAVTSRPSSWPRTSCPGSATRTGTRT